SAISWSPTMAILATASDGEEQADSADHLVRLWSADGGSQSQLVGHRGAVRAVAWSPDGALLASASADTTVRIWSSDGATVQCLTGHTGSVEAVAWSPDGRQLATASADATIRVWPQPARADDLAGRVHRLVGLRRLDQRERDSFLLPPEPSG